MPARIYGARSVIKFDRLRDANDCPAFEERIVVLHASSFDVAIELAEKDAVDYAERSSGVYLSFVDVYEAKECSLSFSGIQEVYSVMRHSDSSSEDYLDHFCDTGKECMGSLPGIDATNGEQSSAPDASHRLSL